MKYSLHSGFPWEIIYDSCSYAWLRHSANGSEQLVEYDDNGSSLWVESKTKPAVLQLMVVKAKYTYVKR